MAINIDKETAFHDATKAFHAAFERFASYFNAFEIGAIEDDEFAIEKRNYLAAREKFDETLKDLHG